jgi:magnesium-transporting ATPase (P-type)
MDTMAALALATESPTKSLLLRKPYGRYEGIITPAMWRNIGGQALCQLVTLFFLLYFPHKIPYFQLPHPSSWSPYQADLHQTLIFNTFVWCQIFNEFNARKLGNGKKLFPIFYFLIILN